MENKKKDTDGCAWLLMIAFFAFFIIIGKNSEASGSYVKPYHTRSGKLVKGHTRKSYSTSTSAFKSRQNSKSYRYRHPYRKEVLGLGK
jgi:hypothetical protein